jgi:signal transduction histidine kinase
MSAQPPALAESATTTTVDNRIIAVMRLVLALSALLITFIDPSAPDRLVAVTYAALSLYTIYSAVLYVIVQRNDRLQAYIIKRAHWADVAWYVVFIALSSGTSSIFFFFFFFAILVASFRWGFRSGLRVVVISAILFTIVGFAAAPEGPNFELNRFLLRPIYLFVLGYMMAYWGGYEITLKRRLALLKEVNTLANPRFGVDRTTSWLLDRLRSFYDADTCMLIAVDSATGEHSMRRADRQNPERAVRAEPLPKELAQRLLALPADHAVIYSRKPHVWWGMRAYYRAHNIVTRERTTEGREVGAGLAAAFDAVSFVSVPLHYHHDLTGRLYLTSTQGNAFDESDLEFLLQAMNHFTRVIENVRLVDRLASDAAEIERQRIAHDLHDSVIQPYIGLQIGLTAIDQKLTDGDTNVSGDIKQLVEQIVKVVDNLRSYMRGLKRPGEREGILLPSVRRFAATFTETTGIGVQVKAAGDMRVNDRLAAEVFQMVTEGLSNVRRHTHAMQASIVLACRDNYMVVRIEDEGVNGATPAPFTPHSISERAAALGGQVHVDRREDGGSAVVVEIPL